jgi:hypothetical protein
MKRLTKFNFGGIPYVNSDFTDILQTQHIKCYAGILDAINVDSYTGRNSGIILKGCDVVAASSTTYSINFADSMIYLDGEFYQYNSTSTSNVVVNSSEFYLYAMATNSQTRYLRNLTSTASVIESTYFTYSLSEPVGTRPYIKFSSKGTSRRYKRILKYFTSNYGDVYVTSTAQSFSATGLGFNDMEGFVMLNGIDNNVPNFSGKFIRGMSHQSLDYDSGIPPRNLFYHELTGISKNEYVGTDKGELVKKYPEIIQSRPGDLYNSIRTAYQRGFYNQVLSTEGTSSVALGLINTPHHKHEMLPTTYSMQHSHVFHTTMNHSPLVKVGSANHYAWGIVGGSVQTDVEGSYTPNASDSPTGLPGIFYISPSNREFYSNFMRAETARNNEPAIPTYFQSPYANINSDAEGLKQQQNFRPCYTYTFGVVHPQWYSLPSFNNDVQVISNKNRYPDYILYNYENLPKINCNNPPCAPNVISKPDLIAIGHEKGSYFASSNDGLNWPNLLTHTHSIPIGSEGFGSDPAQPHENRPEYRVMIYYTKKFTQPISSYTYI